jgi:sulfotransferase family protein
LAGLLKSARSVAGRGRRRVRAMRATRTIEERLVWVFGSPRSGSTWLLRVLGDHDTVVPVNEPMLGWYLGPFLSDLPGFGSAALDSRNFTLRQVQEAKPSQFFADEFEHAWGPALRRMMRDRFAAHVQRYPPRNGAAHALVLIKEPNGSQSADIIMSALPRARFLFLLRDGRDVVDSDLAAHMPGAWVTKEFPGAQGISEGERLDFVVQSARKWLWRTEVTERAYDAHPGPKRTMRYEELLADPAGQMRALLDWLGLDMAEAELQAALDRHAFENVPAERRGSLEFFRAASPGLWRENLTAEEQAAMEEVMGPKLREHGYAAP